MSKGKARLLAKQLKNKDNIAIAIRLARVAAAKVKDEQGLMAARVRTKIFFGSCSNGSGETGKRVDSYGHSSIYGQQGGDMTLELTIDNEMPANAVVPDPRPEKRKQLSGPALRTFENLARLWDLSSAERLAILGHPGRSTMHKWINEATHGQSVTLPFDTLMRLSALLGIHKGLRIVLNSEPEVARWIRTPSTVAPFGGQPPIVLMTEGGFDGLITVRRYIDGWRGGTWLSPQDRAGVKPKFDPADIVFE